MRAGKLDRRITIQRRVSPVQQDSTGGEFIEWEDVATVWAEKRENRGSERFAAQQFIGNAVKTFVVRWSSVLSGANVTWQVICDGRPYDITDVREVGRRQGIEIDAYARGELPLVPQGDVEFVPSLDFSNARNSGYIALVLEDI